jgi:hypothetical protein
METDEQEDFVIHSESVVPEPVASSSKHLESETVGESTVHDEEIESDDDDDDEEEEGGDISLGEEDIDEEEEGEADEDEEMQDADVADEDVTMQSVEHNGPVEHNGSTNLPVAQTA